MNFRVLLTNADSILLSMYQAFLVDQQMTIRTASTATSVPGSAAAMAP